MTKVIYSPNHRFIVQRLKEARKERGMTQKEVAAILERTQSYVAKIESGQRRIDVVQLSQLARIYRKPLNYFLRQNV